MVVKQEAVAGDHFSGVVEHLDRFFSICLGKLSQFMGDPGAYNEPCTVRTGLIHDFLRIAGQCFKIITKAYHFKFVRSEQPDELWKRHPHRTWHFYLPKPHFTDFS